MQPFQIVTPPLQGDAFAARAARGFTFIALLGVAAGGLWLAAKLSPMKPVKKQAR